MGAYSQLDLERQYSDPQEGFALSGFADDDDPTIFEPAACEMPETELAAPAPAPAPAEAIASADATPAVSDTDGTKAQEDEDAKKKAHEEAEAKRKAEFDAKQAAKKVAEQEQLAKVAAMSDDEVTAASMQRVGTDTERLTRRNMKLCVAEYIQTRCVEDPAFARLTMHPVKSMIHCFWYINRKAREYLQEEMKLNDEKPPQGVNGVYGGDVPDDIVYQWAEDYFRDPDAEEDHRDDEKFVPKPYYGGGTSKSKTKEKKKTEKKAEKPKPAPKPKEDDGQFSLLEAAS